jgi:hypothetical protein
MLQHQNRTANHRKACDVGPALPHVGMCWRTRGCYSGSVPPVSAVVVLPWLLGPIRGSRKKY